MGFLSFLYKKKNNFPQVKHVTEFAFTVGGVDYYRCADLLNQPFERALTALVYYREVDLNIDHDFLSDHVEAVDTVLTSSKVDIYRLKHLNDLLKQRVSLPKHPELLWKLASVVYFDKNEDPTVYDFEYNKKKIANWKANATLHTFFLSKPVVELIPYLKYAGENLSTYSRLMVDVHHQHSDMVSDILSEKQKTRSSV